MKKAISVLCSLAIMLVCIGGCGTAGDNPFIADDAIKGQIGDLYYVIPGNAVVDESSTDENNTYRVPIANSIEEYTLYISYSPVEETDETPIQSMEDLREFLAYSIEAFSEEVALYEEEDITDFLGKQVDYGFKINTEIDGQKSVLIYALISHKMYSVGYGAKTGFYDQTVWDNFYAQLKLV